jgi:hypothetical protein
MDVLSSSNYMHVSEKVSEQRPTETKRVWSQSSKQHQTPDTFLQVFYIQYTEQSTGSPCLTLGVISLKTATTNNWQPNPTFEGSASCQEKPTLIQALAMFTEPLVNVKTMSNENCLYILQNAEATDDFDSKNS